MGDYLLFNYNPLNADKTNNEDKFGLNNIPFITTDVFSDC